LKGIVEVVMKKNVLGIDIGRVLMAPVVGGKADTSFLGATLEQAMETPPSPGALEGIAQLTDRFGRAQVHLVSKAGPGVQNKTWHWLRHWDVYGKTGLAPSRVWFCLQRREKADHCRRLGVTHFVDDRLDVLRHLRGVVDHLFLFGEQDPEIHIPAWVVPVADWAEVVERLAEADE
jgi:hypothetical protein